MNDANDIAPAFYIDHEVRIQMIEKNCSEIKTMVGEIRLTIRWMAGILLSSVILPMALKAFRVL